ncbi:PIG-L family deacetylase [Tunturiibacter empetritectus]|uniref:LmbE family N-acetylglucosaminyl deacetylase n=1 Tax=Tunturiibacter lichenicola TaxID=2051959 RepID=A0A852VGA2_9BACT|nr:PIG-L family deacetylase [Edaphobacter lichenicola]NYF89265.1 LmbE family N-acetylglucosaminyl deacetylase [Edaphobacter lichenicola]
MTSKRVVAGLAAVSVMGLVVAGGVLSCQELRDAARLDRANLASEQVRSAIGVQKIAANEGSAALWQSLVKLRTRASLMMIVAHPDDEDGGMLTYEARGQGAHVAMLTLTRGEGGQNLMSADFDDALGLVRTQELLAAGRYMGIDQMWGTQVDFGFSKTKEEAFENWGHDRVLYDAVRAVRLYRPLVVTAVFIGGITDGHGQHQVSGEMAQEVFDAAGDPKVFPDQIAAGLMPWSPLKVYGRVPFFSVTSKGMYDYATGKYAPARFYNYVTKEWTTESPKANVTVPEGDYSPVLGMTYLQFARMGLGLQKTQNGGMGVPAAGRFDVGYHRYGARLLDGAQPREEEKGFFDGVDVTLAGMSALAPGESSFLKQDLAKIDGLVGQAVGVYKIAAPEKTAPFLRDGLKATDELIAKVESSGLTDREKYDLLHELRVKRMQFNDAIVQALGISLRAQVAGKAETGPFARFSDGAETFVTAVPGQSFAVKTLVVNGSKVPVAVKGAGLESSAGATYEGSGAKAGAGEKTIVGGEAYEDLFQVKLPEDAKVTRPPFTRPGIEQAYYDVADPAMRNASLPLPALTAWVTVDYDGVDVKLGQEVQTLHRVTGLGTVYEPLVVAPAISVAVSPSAGVVPLTEKTLMVTARVKSNVKGVATGTVKLELPKGWTATPETAEFSLGKDGDSVDVPFVVTPGKMAETAYTMTAVASYAGKEYREGYKTVGYAGLLPANLYRPATYRARGADVKIAPGLKVGYLPGTGDEVQASLENLGVHATTLTMGDVAGGRLSGYDVVVLGVRAYAAHPGLAAANGQLLQYAKNGGVVIVQYNLGNFDYGPYSFSLGDAEKVVDERAAVRLLVPESPVLSWPNRITERDFDGWVEERGHGFMETWDSQYVAPLETHDPDQDPQKGGLLVAKTGKGAYVYVALALYRELPEGVPGAYRLFANLLSLGKDKAK